jgi:hypothetical protein
MYFLDPKGWYGRPWDTPIRLTKIDENSCGLTMIKSDIFELTFLAEPYKSIFAFEDSGFTIFCQKGSKIKYHSELDVKITEGIFSFVSADRSLPYQDDDPENIIATLHNGFCKNFGRP